MSLFFRHAFVLTVAVCASTAVSAQTARTWSGPSGGDFATAANWGGTAPANSLTTNYALFTGGNVNQAILSASRSIAGLEFAATATAGSISYSNAPVLTLGAYGIRNLASNNYTMDLSVPLALGANSTFTNSGDLWISGALNLSTRTLTLTGTSTWWGRFNGVVSGTGGIVINHTGTGGWILNGNNTYSGGTTLTAGRLLLSASGTGLGTGTLTLNGGSLWGEYNGTVANAISVTANSTLNAYSYATTIYGGAITLTGSRTLTVTGDGKVVFSGAIGQSASGYGLTKAGAGTLVLTAASTNTGATTVSDGTLALSGSGAVSSANLALTGGVLATSGTFTRAFGTGSGQVNLSGGGFAAYGGALSVGFAATDVGSGGFLSGANLKLGSTIADDVVTWTSNLNIGTGGLNVTVDDNTSSSADKGVISGAISGGGVLAKSGAGTLELTGANSHSNLSLLGGTVRVGHANALGTGAASLDNSSVKLEFASDTALTVANQINATVSSTTLSSDRATAGAGLTHSVGALQLTGSNVIAFAKGANVTSGTAGLSTGAVSLGGTTTFQVNNGVAATLASLTGTNTNVTFSSTGSTTVSGAVTTGAGTLTKNGAGTLTLNGSSTRTGATTLSAGTLAVGHDTALGSGTISLTGTGATLDLAADSALSVANQVTVSVLNSTIVSNRATAGAGLTHTLGNLLFSTGVNLALAKGANVTSGTAGFNLGTLTITTGTSQLTVNSGVAASLDAITGTNQNFDISSVGDTTVDGAVATGTGTLAKAGAGTLTLSAASTRTGANTLSGGTLALGSDSALGSGSLTLANVGAALRSSNSARTIGNSLIFATGVNFTGSADLTFTGAATNNSDNTLAVTNTGVTTLAGALDLSNSATNRTLTLNNTGTLVISGAIANGSTSTAGALIKNGSGLLTLSGANTYAGNTTINAGTLRLDGSLANSALTTIASGATLTGAGSLGDLMLAGTYAPGNSPALVSLGDFTVGSTGFLQMEIGGLLRGTQYDALDINGVFATGGTLDVIFINGFNPVAAATFNLFDFTSSSGTFATINLPTLTAGLAWDTSALYSAGELKITGSAIPEPSTYAAFAGLGALGLAFWRRRQARVAARV